MKKLEISKELLGEVLNTPIMTDIKIKTAKDDVTGIELDYKYIYVNYNKYPLDYIARICKEWAIKSNRENKDINNGDHFYINHIAIWNIGFFENYQCDVGYRGKDIDSVYMDITKHFTADTEIEVIIKACEWILTQKDM